MNIEAQEKLRTILLKDCNSLTKGDIIFLKARRDYLSHSHRQKYISVLEPQKEQVRQADQMTYQELMRKAKEMGYKVRVGLKKDELTRMVFGL